MLTRAQSQVYRAIDHRDVMAACQMARNAKTGFPKSISDYASLIVNMYRSRCNADYDPSEAGNFSIPQVLHKIGEVEEAIRRFNSVNADDRLAFALLVVVKKARRDQM